jgi:UDP-glucose 4-epimerase
MIKVAIVGANGFVGRSLSRHLELVGIDVIQFNSSQPLVIEEKLDSNLEDVSSVIWCASRVNPLTAETRTDLAALEYLEFKSFLDIWEKDSSPQQSLIYLSSGGCTYSGENNPFTELSLAEGTNRYGKLKIEIENAILSTKVSCIVLRVSNVYGPEQPHGRGQGVIAEWKNSINSKKNIEVYGSLESFRDYIFIDDLSEAVRQSLDIGEGQRILNLGSGTPTQLGEILEFVSSLNLENTKIEFQNRRLTDRNGYFLDISKFKSLTGWKPKYTIQNGLMKTFGVEIVPE